MKSWDEAKNGTVVYIKDPIEYEDEDGEMKTTSAFQKAVVDTSYCCEEECTPVVVDGGEADGYDFYFRHNESSVDDLLIEDEMSVSAKVCKNCGFVVEKKMKYAYESNWCPSCGSNLV